jgi:hypothetical protein
MTLGLGRLVEEGLGRSSRARGGIKLFKVIQKKQIPPRKDLFSRFPIILCEQKMYAARI